MLLFNFHSKFVRNGAYTVYSCRVSLHGWGYCFGNLPYIHAPVELHRTYLSEIHCSHHLYGSCEYLKLSMVYAEFYIFVISLIYIHVDYVIFQFCHQLLYSVRMHLSVQLQNQFCTSILHQFICIVLIVLYFSIYTQILFFS